MVPERAEMRCNAPADQVLDFLAGGAGLPYRVQRARGSPSTLVFSTGMSAFSWGEKIEVTVVEQGTGSTVTFRGSRVFTLNVTSNPRTPVEKILHALQAKFGLLTA
jgi:hypothetical protein